MDKNQIRIQGKVGDILARAPKAVESYHAGHWELLCRLERDAQAILKSRSVEPAVSFLANVAFLKMPYHVDQFRKAKIRERLIEHSEAVMATIDALSDLDAQDYGAMNVLAKVPYFGIHGGRAFNSAVMRLVYPEKFAIIDWRNLAVITGADGFDGLIEPPMVFKRVKKETIVREKGHLLCSQDIYEEYNTTLRELADAYGIRTADVDLLLWTYSIDRKPFRSNQQQDSIFEQIFGGLLRMDAKRRLKDKDISNQITNLKQSYIATLAELGWLPPDKIRNELRTVFGVIRDECEAYGKNKPWLGLRVKKITLALETGMKAKYGERLLGHWRRWENMLNPASPDYIGIELPGSMIMEGYLVFEQLVPIREYFEQKYTDSSFEPVEPSECISISVETDNDL